MSITGQGEKGIIELFDDFCGPEFPVANAVAYGTSPTHAAIGPFRITGDLGETDTGVVGISKAGGFIRISGNDENGKGVFVGTEVVFSPTLNGGIVVECRLEMQALTTRNVFVGLMGTNADDVAEPATAATATITKVVPCVGFLFDSQLTDADQWHMPYLKASDTSQVSTTVDASQAAVAGECDVLRLEVERDGSAKWFINGKLEQSVGAGEAAVVGTLMAAGVGCWGTTTTAADVDVDYLLVRANRDWTR